MKPVERVKLLVNKGMHKNYPLGEIWGLWIDCIVLSLNNYKDRMWNLIWYTQLCSSSQEIVVPIKRMEYEV